MDIQFHRTEYNQRVGTLSKTKRVRKPNQDEPEQNQKRFAEQFAQANRDNSEDGDGNHSGHPEDAGPAKGTKLNVNSAGKPDEGAPGQVIDITI